MAGIEARYTALEDAIGGRRVVDVDTLLGLNHSQPVGDVVLRVRQKVVCEVDGGC